MEDWYGIESLEDMEGGAAQRARVFAIHYHGDQKYGDKPYIYHLDMVRSFIDNAEFTSPKAVAYLHDILEDTYCDYETLLNSFEKPIADAVLKLTKTKGQSYEDYIQQVKSSKLSLTVKIADTKANLTQSVLDDNKARIVKYAKQLVLLEN